MIDRFSEDELVEQAAIEVFTALGYEHMDCYDELATNPVLGREASIDVILKNRLRPALVKLNPTLLPEVIDQAVEELTRDRSSSNRVIANREVYKLLKDGIKVTIKKDDGSEDQEALKVIDFNNPGNNNWLLASQLWITGEMYKRRADLVLFVNGIPLVLIELKGAHKKLKNAYDDNLRDYKKSIPQLFWYNAFIILSNGSESKAGTITAEWEHFSEWKKINKENEEGIVSLDTILKGICAKDKLLDIIENFILFQDIGGSLIKISAKNHQYIGVNNAIESFKNIEQSKGNLGIFWHTQGSGKSFSMIFFSQKVLRKFYGQHTFVIITDRRALDEQIYKNFASVGAVTEQDVHTESREHLKQLLKESHRNIFTTIHMFGTDVMISDRKDIIVMADEAHRTQYDVLAYNMRRSLPNAAFIAFTATPLIESEEKTKDTFGGYVSIYSFKDSVKDNATVALYYENRIPEVQLDAATLTDRLEDILTETILDDKQEEKLVKEFSREYHIITREDRLDKIAEDIAGHFAERKYQGKAMVISIDKLTAVKMYDKVQKYWKQYIKKLREDLNTADGDELKKEIYTNINYMEETDMAVVVCQGQNEEAKCKEAGLDIKPHRKRIVQEDLATKFKDPDDKFRIVFVCAMWMTGFDVPCLSTIYLDKPMRNHTLMQAIARVNRVFRDKPSGLIVDYAGIFRNLQKALAIYNPGGIEIDYPVRPKEELIEELDKTINKMTELCKGKGIGIDKILAADKLKTIKLLDNAVDAILGTKGLKSEYMSLAYAIHRLQKSIMPDTRIKPYRYKCSLFKVIAEKIRSLAPEVDITEAKDKIVEAIDEAITAKGYIIKQPFGLHRIDLSKIDFDAIKKRFVENRKHIETEQLQYMLKRKLEEMYRMNKTRKDLIEVFETLVREYNLGTINVELFFEQLLKFAKQLSEEDKRAISENLTEEELVIFDLLQKPPDLTSKEIKQVKKVAKGLLDALKREKLVLDWRRKQQTRADVMRTIEVILDEKLPDSYSKDLYQEKCGSIYQHVYDSYYGQGRSIYAA